LILATNEHELNEVLLCHPERSEGSPIWTESSYKYRPDDIAQTLERCGFKQSAQWLDAEAGFALMLASVPA
jgi:uncharacterized SAM-dependent methyltransferase